MPITTPRTTPNPTSNPISNPTSNSIDRNSTLNLDEDSIRDLCFANTQLDSSGGDSLPSVVCYLSLFHYY